MAQIAIKRAKVAYCFAVALNCYINDQLVCKLKNGEQTTCAALDGVITFKCNYGNNAMSDTLCLDMQGKNNLQITVKPGTLRPQIALSDESALVEAKKATSSSVPKVIAAPAKVPKGTSPQCFFPTKSIGEYFAINESTRQWAVGKGFVPSLKKAVLYSYEDIVDFELLEDGTSVTKGGVGSAIVGGLLFGGLGVLAGAVTGGKKAQQKCTSLMIKITVNNIETPVEYIKLITSAVDKKSSVYKKAFQNAQEIVSLLQLVCSQHSSNTPVEEHASNFSAADELLKFKQLFDNGIITAEEFAAKKKELIGI